MEELRELLSSLSQAGMHTNDGLDFDEVLQGALDSTPLVTSIPLRGYELAG